MNRLRILETERSNNEQRTASLQDILDQKQNAIAKTVHKIGEAHAII
jgi:hypothetical protein